MAGTLLHRRCNPYGAETGGPRRVLGGLYGPGSAMSSPDLDLPQNVTEGEWPCDQPAQVRCRMTCKCGHTGQIMELCSDHDITTYRGEYVAGQFRQVKELGTSRGHFEEIQRRQSDFCPRCGYPDARQSGNGIDYATLQKEWDGIGRTLRVMWEASGFNMRIFRDPLVMSYQTRRDDIGRMFDEARALGIVHNCPMRLVPVS
jgi:hypothetical protein